MSEPILKSGYVPSDDPPGKPPKIAGRVFRQEIEVYLHTSDGRFHSDPPGPVAAWFNEWWDTEGKFRKGPGDELAAKMEATAEQMGFFWELTQDYKAFVDSIDYPEGTIF